MWAGTFTKNWVTNLTKMGINEATAVNFARKIRKQIMHNTAEIWRTRCNAAHDNKERDAVLEKMKLTAETAKALDIMQHANSSVQRACEMHSNLSPIRDTAADWPRIPRPIKK